MRISKSETNSKIEIWKLFRYFVLFIVLRIFFVFRASDFDFVSTTYVCPIVAPLSEWRIHDLENRATLRFALECSSCEQYRSRSCQPGWIWRYETIVQHFQAAARQAAPTKTLLCTARHSRSWIAAQSSSDRGAISDYSEIRIRLFPF